MQVKTWLWGWVCGFSFWGWIIFKSDWFSCNLFCCKYSLMKRKFSFLYSTLEAAEKDVKIVCQLSIVQRIILVPFLCLYRKDVKLTYDTHINLVLFQSFTASDYVAAQCLRWVKILPVHYLPSTVLCIQNGYALQRRCRSIFVVRYLQVLKKTLWLKADKLMKPWLWMHTFSEN